MKEGWGSNPPAFFMFAAHICGLAAENRKVKVKAAAARFVVAALLASETIAAEPRPSGPLSKSGIYFHRVAIEELERLHGRSTKFDSLKAAAVRFRDVHACLASDRTKAAALKIDWYKIGSDEEAGICLSRVASRIGTAHGMAAWLRSNGFTVSWLKVADDGYANPVAARVGFDISSEWSIKRNGPMTRRGIISPFMQSLLGYGVSCGIFMSPGGKVVSVNCTTLIL